MTRSKSSVPSLIASDLTITGDLNGMSELQIDGSVEGNVNCTILIIGDQGKVNGKVMAEEVIVSGGFTGSIKARSVELKETARVKADITVQDALAVETGAVYEGQCKRVATPEKVESTGKFGGAKKLPEGAVASAKFGAAQKSAVS